MANDLLPQTIISCDGCGQDLNILGAYLNVMLKAQREVLVSENAPSADPNEAEANIYLGTKSGRGVIKKFHGFDCIAQYCDARAGSVAKIESYGEDEIYVPEDNPTEEEIAQRLAEEEAAAAAAAGTNTPPEGGES